MIQNKPSLRVHYLDENPVCHSGLLSVVAEYTDCSLDLLATDISQLPPKPTPELIVVEIGALMPKGMPALRDIKQIYPHTPILVLTVYEEEIYAERCLKAGASGYIMKTASLTDIARAMKRVIGGDLYVSDRVKNRMVERLVNPSPQKDDSGLNCLSDRELLIVEQIGLSKNNKEIAQALQISVKTIESHRSRIKAKLRLESPQELMRYAMKMHPV